MAGTAEGHANHPSTLGPARSGPKALGATVRWPVVYGGGGQLRDRPAHPLRGGRVLSVLVVMVWLRGWNVSSAYVLS